MSVRFKGKKFLEDFWYENYCGGFCTLCGNSGVIDTRGVKTPAGVSCGRLNWCICPNGQAIRIQSGLKLPPQPTLVKKYKCSECKDTGEVTWTDQAWGQGLDREVTERCKKCR